MRRKEFLRRPDIVDKTRQVIRLTGARLSVILKRRMACLSGRRVRRYCAIGIGLLFAWDVFTVVRILGHPLLMRMIPITWPVFIRPARERSLDSLNRDSVASFVEKGIGTGR